MNDGHPDDLFDPIFDDEPSDEPVATFPWPPRSDESSIDALGRTWSGALFHPARFFSSMPIDASLAPAVVFLLIATYAGAGVNLFWQMVLPTPGWLPPEFQSTGAEAVSGFLLAGPFALAVSTIVALIVHVGLIVFGARRERAANTVAVTYYVSAASIFQVIPWLGALLAGFWGIAISIIGVREVHRTSTMRAAAAVLVPMFGLIAFLVGLVMLVVLAGVSSGLITR